MSTALADKNDLFYTAVLHGNEIENSEKYIFFMSNCIFRMPKLYIGLIYNKLKMKKCNSGSFGARRKYFRSKWGKISREIH